MDQAGVDEAGAAGRWGSVVALLQTLGDDSRPPPRRARSIWDSRRLPAPVTDTWDWQMHAACRGLDSSLFFHPDHERGPTRVAREARAKYVCGQCPVLDHCRRHAEAVREPYGVWGGLSPAERAARTGSRLA